MSLLKKKKDQIIFTISTDDKGFTLSTKIVGKITIQHIDAVSKYTQSKVNEYNHQIKKAKKANK